MSNVAETVSPLLATGLRTLEFARGVTQMLLEKTDDSLFFKRPFPGANHPAWIVGHLATTDDLFLSMLGGRERVLAWDELFNMGSKCLDDASAYPSRAELEGAMKERREAMLAWLSGLSDEELLAPIEGDLASFASTKAMLMSSMAWHEGTHSGQLAWARRAAGLEPLF